MDTPNVWHFCRGLAAIAAGLFMIAVLAAEAASSDADLRRRNLARASGWYVFVVGTFGAGLITAGSFWIRGAL